MRKYTLQKCKWDGEWTDEFHTYTYEEARTIWEYHPDRHDFQWRILEAHEL